jgi:hypothetical protein
MDFSKISERIDRVKNTIKTVSLQPEEARDIVVDINKETVPRYEKKTALTREKFEELLDGYAKMPADDMNIGDFVRYKQRKDGTIRYLYGGMLIYKDPRFLRLKNLKNGFVWSVQLQSSNVQNVFYSKTPTKLEKDGLYVNLNTATTEGILSAIVERGDYKALEAAGKLARRNAINKVGN